MTPNHVLTKAGDVLLGVDIDIQFSLIPTVPAQVTWGVAVAGVAMILVFVVGALLAVQVRNFE